MTMTWHWSQNSLTWVRSSRPTILLLAGSERQWAHTACAASGAKAGASDVTPLSQHSRIQGHHSLSLQLSWRQSFDAAMVANINLIVKYMLYGPYRHGLLTDERDGSMYAMHGFLEAT
jgi:hypothetical protein